MSSRSTEIRIASSPFKPGFYRLARLTPEGFQEISRANLIEPTTDQLPRRDGVTWSHPAFAYRHVFARNDKALVCADLSAAQQ